MNQSGSTMVAVASQSFGSFSDEPVVQLAGSLQNPYESIRSVAPYHPATTAQARSYHPNALLAHGLRLASRLSGLCVPSQDLQAAEWLEGASTCVLQLAIVGTWKGLS